MEDIGIVYGHLVHFKVFCYIFWTFSIVRGNLVYFFPFWYFVPRKIWQPCLPARRIVFIGWSYALLMAYGMLHNVINYL
jgi:hypothetical protein